MLLERRRALASVAVAALLAGLTGCGGGGESAQAQATPTATVEPEPTKAPTGLQPVEQQDPFAGVRKAGAELGDLTDRLALGSTARRDGGAGDGAAVTFRRQLTYALTEQVYLAALAVQTAVEKSEASQVVKQAIDALEENSAAVVEVFGRLLDDAQREEFRTGWQAFSRSLYDYGVAVKDDDSTGRGKALEVMENYRVTLAELFTTVTDGKLPQYRTKDAMKDHIYVVKKVLDAVAKEDPEGFDLLGEARESVGRTALAFTKGFQTEADDAGEVEDQAAGVRAKLAGLTVAHTYLAAMSYVTAYADPKRFSGVPYNKAKVAIDDNAKAIGEVVKDVSTSAQEAKFLEEWRGAVRDLEDYAEGAYFDSQRVRQGALDYLEQDRKTAGRFFDRLTKGRDAEELSGLLSRHLATFAGTIDALKAAFARSRS